MQNFPYVLKSLTISWKNRVMWFWPTRHLWSHSIPSIDSERPDNPFLSGISQMRQRSCNPSNRWKFDHSYFVPSTLHLSEHNKNSKSPSCGCVWRNLKVLLYSRIFVEYSKKLSTFSALAGRKKNMTERKSKIPGLWLLRALGLT